MKMISNTYKEIRIKEKYGVHIEDDNV